MLFFLQSPIAPKFISWQHNGRLLNYDQHRGGVTIATEHGKKTTSHLTIADATTADSGNYSCGAPNTEAAEVHVFVSRGEGFVCLIEFHEPCSWCENAATRKLPPDVMLS